MFHSLCYLKILDLHNLKSHFVKERCLWVGDDCLDFRGGFVVCSEAHFIVCNNCIEKME